MRTLRSSVRDRIPVRWKFRWFATREYDEPRYLLRPLRDVERDVVTRRFREVHGRLPNLDAPRTFNEKIQWRKLFDRRRIWPTLLDKYRVRDWLRSRVGSAYLIPLLHVGTRPSDIPFDRLDPPYVVKPNHMSGVVFRVVNREDLGVQRCRNMVESLRWHLRKPYGLPGVEWGYWQIEPRIVVERLLLDEGGVNARDYKFHCFDGNPKFVQVHLDRFEHHRRTVFTTDWQRLDLGWKDRPRGPDLPPPATLDEMLEVASALAEGFGYIRADLYSIGQEVYVGEMTPYTHSGFAPFRPESWDVDWGERWPLPGRSSEAAHPEGIDSAVRG